MRDIGQRAWTNRPPRVGYWKVGIEFVVVRVDRGYAAVVIGVIITGASAVAAVFVLITVARYSREAGGIACLFGGDAAPGNTNEQSELEHYFCVCARASPQLEINKSKS